MCNELPMCNTRGSSNLLKTALYFLYLSKYVIKMLKKSISWQLFTNGGVLNFILMLKKYVDLQKFFTSGIITMVKLF